MPKQKSRVHCRSLERESPGGVRPRLLVQVVGGFLAGVTQPWLRMMDDFNDSMRMINNDAMMMMMMMMVMMMMMLMMMMTDDNESDSAE